MAQTIQIGGTSYSLRRQTMRAMLHQQRAQDERAEAYDRLASANQHLDVVGRQLAQLGANTTYDADAAGQLIELRRTLRAEASKLSEQFLLAQAEVIRSRLEEPAPTVDAIIDALDAEDIERVMTELGEGEDDGPDPTTPPSEGAGETS